MRKNGKKWNDEIMSNTIHDQATNLVTQAFEETYEGISIVPQQISEEIISLLEILIPLKPKRMMEIGTSTGGTLWLWTQICDPKAMIISLDLIDPTVGGGYDENRKKIYATFAQLNQELFLVQGNSHLPESFGMIKGILKDELLDVLFIDGDHSYEGVEKDFEMYSKLVKPHGLIIFHDITLHPAKFHCHVQAYWDNIKDQYKTQEIRGTPDEKRMIYGGIGILINPGHQVAILMMAHNIDTPLKKDLFARSTYQLSLLNYPKTLWCDETVSENIIEIAERNKFTIVRNCPNTEWSKFRYAYDHTDADYVAICHSDDIWIQGKLEAQLKYIDKAALVMTGVLIQNYYTKTPDHPVMWQAAIHFRSPQILGDLGIVDCLPSTWLLNKRFVQSIPDPFQETFGKDCAIATMIAAECGPVISIKEPFVIYNEHEDNQWFESNADRHRFAIECIKATAKKYGNKVQLFHAGDAIDTPKRIRDNKMLLSAFKQPQHIMIIGWFDLNKYGHPLADSFEKQGHTVYRVSTDYFPTTCDYALVNHYDDSIFTRKAYLKVSEVLAVYPDTDMIILCQSTQLEYDCENVFVPTYLFWSEPAYHFWPKNSQHCIVGVFATSQAILNELEIDHRIEFQCPAIKFKEVLPWAINPDVYPNRGQNRNIEIGFQGAREWKNNPLPKDYAMSTFYDNRNWYLEYVQKEFGADIRDRDWTENYHVSLVDFYNKVNLAINIAGWENINERMYFVMSMGCVLLQYATPDLHDLGFGDYYNCLLFTNREELKAKIEWARKNPDKLEEIRKYGQVFAKENTWELRGLQMLSKIAKVQAAQRKRISWIQKYQEHVKERDGNAISENTKL